MNEGARMGDISASRAFSRRREKVFPPPSPSPTKQFETLQFPSLRSRGSFAFSVHTYFVQFRGRRRKRADVSGNFSRAFYFGGEEEGRGNWFRRNFSHRAGKFVWHFSLPKCKRKLGISLSSFLQKLRPLERDTIASFLCSAHYCTVKASQKKQKSRLDRHAFRPRGKEFEITSQFRLSFSRVQAGTSCRTLATS